MPMELRGGIPRVFRATVPATGDGYDPAGHRFPSTTKRIRVRNTGANVLRVYFLQGDFDDDANYVELEVDDDPFDMDCELEKVWLRATGGDTAVEIVSIQRRG